MISYSKTFRITAMLCTILTAGFAVGQDGVVRMSDRSITSSQVGVVQMRARQLGPQFQQVSHSQNGCTVAPGCAASPGCGTGDPGTCSPCGHSGCNCGCSVGQCCTCSSCYTTTDCNQIFSSCDTSGMPACWCQDCNCAPCQCGRRNGRGQGYSCDDNVTLFAHSVDSGTGSACRDFCHGQAMSFHNKNARLADKLFGWMIPSGCCGQGCPPCGKYHMTYADQPDYIHPNDTQVYAAQGYGMPITVPLAPNVNHAYNYSAGVPSSRITTIGNYNPQTSPQRLPHQTW